MTKEQQIKEMAKVVAEVQYLGGLEEKVASLLYERGCRKIRTTNWLTKGIPEDQLEREKQKALDEFEREMVSNKGEEK